MRKLAGTQLVPLMRCLGVGFHSQVMNSCEILLLNHLSSHVYSNVYINFCLFLVCKADTEREGALVLK